MWQNYDFGIEIRNNKLQSFFQSHSSYEHKNDRFVQGIN